ncbi:MAG: hypothetical protein ABI422_02235 [Sphingomicrobium sp.]
MSKSDDVSYESSIVPPGAVFVAADAPLLVFPSVMAAKNSLEAIDVVEGVYPAAYGPNGEPYCISCEGNRVLIEHTGGSNRPDDLKALLLQYLEACEDPADAMQPLDELVAIAWSIERNFWLRNNPFGGRSGARIPIRAYIAIALVLGALWYFGFR